MPRELLTRFAVVFLIFCGGVGIPGQTDTATLRGRITDQVGDPLPGAEITVSAVAPGLTKSVNAAANGEYTIPELSAGIRAVSVKLLGFVPRTEAVSIISGQNLLDIGLDVAVVGDNEPFRVSGSVRTDKGDELSNASVTLRNVYQPLLAVQTRTDSDGRFNLLMQKRGDYVLSAALPGYRAAVVGVRLESNLKMPSDLILRASK